MDSQWKYTMFQGHEVTKVKVRHDLKMTLTVKFVEYSRVVARLKGLDV